MRVNGRLRTESTAATHAVVRDGLGTGQTPLWQIHDLVDRGLAEIVLEEFEAARVPIYAVWPPTKMPLTRMRLFIDFFASRLKRECL